MLKELLKSNGIEHFGVSRPKDYNIETHFENRQNKSDFEHELELRLNVSDYFLGCQSILSVGVLYPVFSDGIEGGCGRVTAMAWGHDYHKTVKGYLEKIVVALKEAYGDFDYKFHVDAGPLVDRELAFNSGLGFFGKNQMIISPENGLNFYIGHILVSIDLDYKSDLVEFMCKDCRKCIEACPNNALSENYGFDPNLCLSELTQRKSHLNVIEMEAIGMNIYGCDVCQLVCPYLNGEIDCDLYTSSKAQLELASILALSNKKFAKAYKETGFYWRGLKIIKRNAIICMGNSGDENYLGPLKEHALTVNDYHRRYIVYAIIRLKQKSVVDYMPVLNDNIINGILNDFDNFIKNS